MTEIKLDRLRMLLPVEAGSNLVQYRARVKSIMEFTFCGQPMLDLALDVGDIEDDEPLMIQLIVCLPSCEQIECGDFVEGSAWLHGFVADTFIHFDF